MKLFIRFERGRDAVMGPTFGPYEFIQQTYEELRVGLNGDALAYWNEEASEWFLIDDISSCGQVGEHRGEFYSDFIIYAGNEHEKTDHNCAAGRVTYANGVDQKWEHDKWVPTTSIPH